MKKIYVTSLRVKFGFSGCFVVDRLGFGGGLEPFRIQEVDVSLISCSMGCSCSGYSSGDGLVSYWIL